MSQEKEALDAALQVRLRRVWYGVAELVSLALFDVTCGAFKSCTFFGMSLPRVVISFFQRLRVLSLASAAGAFGQTELILVWGSARLQVNYTPGIGIRDTAEDVCEVVAADDDEACAASLKDQILQQELHYFNLRDGKNLLVAAVRGLELTVFSIKHAFLSLHAVDDFFAEQALRTEEQEDQGQHVRKPNFYTPAHKGP